MEFEDWYALTYGRYENYQQPLMKNFAQDVWRAAARGSDSERWAKLADSVAAKHEKNAEQLEAEGHPNFSGYYSKASGASEVAAAIREGLTEAKPYCKPS